MTKSRLYIVVLGWLLFSSLIYGQANRTYSRVEDFCDCREKNMTIDDIYLTFSSIAQFDLEPEYDIFLEIKKHLEENVTAKTIHSELQNKIYPRLYKYKIEDLKNSIAFILTKKNSRNIIILKKEIYCEIAIFLHTNYGNHPEKIKVKSDEPKNFYRKLYTESKGNLIYIPLPSASTLRKPKKETKTDDPKRQSVASQDTNIGTESPSHVNTKSVVPKTKVNGKNNMYTSTLGWLFLWIAWIAIISWLIYLRVPIMNFFIRQYNKWVVPKTKYSARQNYADKFGFKFKSRAMKNEEIYKFIEEARKKIAESNRKDFEKKKQEIHAMLNHAKTQSDNYITKLAEAYEHLNSTYIRKDTFQEELAKEENLNIINEQLGLFAGPPSVILSTSNQNLENDFSEWMEKYDKKLEDYDEKLNGLKSKIPTNDLTPVIEKLVDERLEEYLKDREPKEEVKQESQYTSRSIQPIVDKKIDELDKNLSRSIEYLKDEQKKTSDKLENLLSRKSKSSPGKEAEEFQKFLSPITTNFENFQRKANSKTIEIETSVQELTKKIDNKDTAHDESVENFKTQIESLNSLLKTSNNSRQALRESVEAQKQELNNASAEINNLKQQLAEAQAKNEQISKALEQQKIDLEKVHDEKLKTVKDDLLEDNKIYRAENQKEFLDLKSELFALRESLKNKSVDRTSSVSKSTSPPTQKKPQNLDYKKPPAPPLTGNLKYSESPRNGTFYDKKLASNPGDSHYFVLSIDENANQGKFSIINNKETIRAASNYLDAVVLPSAEVSGTPNSGDLFEIIEHGTVVHDGNNWKIQDKMKIQF